MAVTVSQAASLTINGITPAAGTGLVLLANPSLATSNASFNDYFANTFVVNVSTPDTIQSMGNIVTGKVVWLQTDQQITVTLTQSATANAFVVESFMYMNADFTQIEIANASALTAANINLVIAGDRVTNPGTPGIF